MDRCTIGERLGEQCHVISEGLCRKAGFINIADLESESKELLSWRSDVDIFDVDQGTVCFYHEKKFLSRYESLQKVCCDPFHKHKKNITKCLKVVDIATATALKLKPGQKLCVHCNILSRSTEAEKESESSDEAYIPPEKPEKFNKIAAELGCSPFKIAKISQRDKAAYGRRKLVQIKEAAKSKVAQILSVSGDNLSSHYDQECEGCADLDILVKLLKEKCMVATRQEKLSILTLAPKSWSIEKTANEFSVSRHMVKRARQMKKEQGVLAKPAQNKGKELSQITRKTVIEIYESDEYSRVCPGKKDYVSIKVDGKRVQVQKRLLLVNLKELYISFTKNSGLKIGFSKFCELRPKSCVTVAASGQHSVCVCEIHQNAKLLLSAAPGKLDYKEVISKMVCNIEARNCMLHECDYCRGKEAAEQYLREEFEKQDMDDDDTVEYKQWLHTDRTTLVSLQLPVIDFIKTVSESLNNLRHHHFIAKAQASYLRQTKENLQQGTAVILMDFAENYSFVVQDAVQGQHWNNSQTTLHPFTIYYKDGDELKCLSLCVVSDHLQHNTNVVHAFISVVVAHLKKILQISRIIYFTDGAASQYKNYKNLTNLCYHMKDHGVEAEWHFFATSHGKSPCDGIGGTVKRLVARASLQATTTKQILTPRELFAWSVENIHGISFFFISSEDVQRDELNFALEDRYASVKTIPGTRSHHSFVPKSDGSLHMKRISEDIGHSVIQLLATTLDMHQRDTDKNSNNLYQPGQYVACIYDSEWHIGNIVERSDENSDVLISFMHRAENTRLSWPRNEDKCWVPFEHVLCAISVPEVEGVSARQYRLSQNDYDNVLHHLDVYSTK